MAKSKIVVIKLGGSTLGGKTSTGTPDTTLDDLLRLVADGFRPVLVHGGGNAISGLLKRLGHEARFQNGLRVTDQPALEAALMVLRGQINAELVEAINRAGRNTGVTALGLSGLDGRLLEARRETSFGDIGLVGDIVGINLAPLQALLESGLLPVIAPLGMAVDDPAARIYNINADSVAAHLAAALQAEVCVFLTDVPGVLDRAKNTITRLDPALVPQLVEQGVISGGMIPKINSALKALEGAQRVLIIDGRPPNALYRAVAQGEVTGTTISKA